MRPPLNDLTGHTFGSLSVIELKGRAKDSKKTPLWICSCSCGSREVVPQRLLVSGKKYQCSECNRPRCDVCGKKIPEDYASKTTCSDNCKSIRKREKAREQYYQRFERDPDLNKKQQKRKKEKAEKDPSYSARLRDYEERALRKKREKRQTDEEWAELERQRSRQRYETNRDQILEGRKTRRRLDSEYAERRRKQEQDYYWRNRCERLTSRKEIWDSLPDEEKARRAENKRKLDRVNKRRRMAELKRHPELFREYQAKQRAWERERNLRRLFTSLDKLKDYDDE